MRIGIDASMFYNQYKTGIPTAVEAVIRQFNQRYPENEYFLFSRRSIELDIEMKPNWHIILSPWKYASKGKFNPVSKLAGALYHWVFFPYQRRKYKLDIFWGPCYYLPVKTGKGKYVVSIYDLAMYRFKDINGLFKRIKHKVIIPLSCRRADKIITISRASAEDIHELLNVRKSKIAISYLGGLSRKSSGKLEFNSSMKPELNIKGRFILFISTIEPRKNIITLIKAFEEYLDRYHDSDLYLVLAGGRGWKCDDIYRTAETSRYRDRIIMPGFISDEEKQYLLSSAAVFAYPSLYEGFGIPVLEAFEKQLPVVTTRVSSLPEVGGDAAFYIDDPHDASALAAQLRRALTLTESERADLNKRTERRLKKFSWEKNADEIMRVFKKLTAGK
ncbi:MAG: glycosyltransferase family 4 protein [Ruminococcus sp.]|nr:glycosyltransferase family 4 protein [Ruminococcus sp.]